MTDASATVSHEAAIDLAERYFHAIGAEILKQDDSWEVIIPESAETPFDDGVIEVSVSKEDVADFDGPSIRPESGFFEQITTAASKLAPVGVASLTSEKIDTSYPDWIEGGRLQVESAEFTPHYDRMALCCLVRVSVETVSEFESDYLRAITVDLRSLDRLAQMSTTFLGRYEDPMIWEHTDSELHSSESTLADAVDAAQQHAREEMSSHIQDTVNEAARNAAVEFDEYREYEEQRLEELTADIERIEEKLHDINSEFETVTDQHERVDLLEERQELRSELETLTNELETIKRRQDHGFPEKREQIYDRHSVEVKLHPYTASLIVYERGELDLELATDNGNHSVTVRYATGQGTTDDVKCSICQKQLSAENPGTLSSSGLIGEDCCYSS